MVDFKLTADGKIDVNSVNIELAAKDDPETCKKVEDFCAYLDAYQSSLSIPATVVDDLNTLAAEIAARPQWATATLRERRMLARLLSP